MAVAGGTQALIATFAFGLVALASFSAACLFTFGSRRLRGSAPVSKGLRLVLVTFLLSSAFWSIMDFAATLTTGDADAACQVLVATAAGFDQLARLAFEQFLLWRIKLDKRSRGLFVLQVIIFVRFIMGGVLVAVQRPQIYPVCIAKSILVPLGIATLVMDVIIVFILFVLIWAAKASIPTTRIPGSSVMPAKVITFLTSGFAAWLATSIPLIFGLEMFPFATRTVVPAIGLLLLLGLVVLFRSDLLITQPGPLLSPERPNTSKALPIRPAESPDVNSTPEVFNRPWGEPQVHIAQTQRPGTGPRPMPKPGSRGIDTALPIINRPTPGQTQRGVGGVPVKGQLFPPIRANTAPIVLQNPPKKRAKGKLAISNPVIRESSALKIMDNIPTVDLAVAAKNDQERRFEASKAARSNSTGQNQALTRNFQGSSFRRKEISTANNVPAATSERSFLSANAATTATQVSPGADELRRRSPQTPLDTSGWVPRPPARSPRRPSSSALGQSEAAAAPAIPPQSRMRKSGSGNSVLRDTSSIFIDPNTPPAIPTPLRQENNDWPRHDTAESPLVPRVEPLPMPIPTTQPDTVPSKYYGNTASVAARASVLTRSGPGSVRRDIRPSRQRPDSHNADAQESVPAKTPVQLRAVNGIPLNPRAQLARDSAKEGGERGKTVMFSNKLDVGKTEEPVSRQIFALSLAGSTPSTGGSIVHRPRPIPRKRSSSTPSTGSIVHRPRPIPSKRSIYKAEFTIKVSPTVWRHRLSRSGGSVELHRESMDSEGDTISRIPSFPEPPKSAGAILVLGTYKTISDNADTPGSIDESYSDRDSFFADSAPFNMAGIDPKTAQSESTDFGGRASMEPEVAYNIRRQSSPVLPVEDLRQVSVVSTELQFAEDGALASLPSSARSGKSTGSQHDGEKEMVPLVLDTQAEASSTGPSSQRDSLAQPAGWHRRVGDACPTFSNRKNGEKSPRRVVAPTPLLLSRSSRTRIAESPAPPLESPQHALDIIQQQLKDLDEADSEAAVEDKQRRKLLENLEAEMGAQETHWQDIRRNLTNRSPSSIRSSLSLVPSGDLHLSPRPSSPALRSPDLGLPVMRGGADPTSAPKNHTKTPADEKSDPAPSRLTRRSNSGFTDEVSAQATVGGVENRAKFGKSASRNKDGLESTSITNDIFAHRQLANHSTTPEKTEAKGKDEDEEFNSASAKKNNLNTWTEPGSVKFVPVEKAPLPVSHWSIDSDTTSLASETLQRAQNIAQAPDNLIRTAASTSPLSRDAGETQALQSINKGFVSPTSPASATWLSRESLISPPVSEQTQSPRRPVTQKPPRRSKRITLLPDIPESPKPLSNKRGTLGFFQFPWGETSDNATLPAQLASVPLPGATLNELTQAQPFVPSQGPVLPSQVYPASFFDHYSDDELPAADSDEGYSDDEDEAFDETTLWEIANLLRSSAVPSRGSLFPGSEDYRPPSRAGFVSNDETTVLAVRELPTVDISKDKALPPLPPADTAVWKSNTMYATTTTRSAGLAQPDAKTWTRYLGKPAETLRPAPRKSVPASISSSSLWAPAVAKTEPVAKSTSSSLWRSPKEVPTTPASTNPSTPFLASPSTTESSISQMSAPIKATSQSYLLWTPPPSVARVPLGLPQDDGEWDRYTAKKVQSSRPKPRPSTQDAIQSTGLWTSSKFVAAASALAPTTTRAVSPSQSLWSKPAIPTEHAEGLWSASHIRHRYKTTDKRPAALDTERKLRIDRRPLAALRSASLWSTTTQTPTRQVPDWLALSTTLRPVSPDGASTLSDQDYGSAFDTYSLRSEVTAASSVAAAKQPAHRKTASKQAAQDELDAAFRDVMQTKPVVPEPVAEEEAAQPPQEFDEKVELFFDSSRFHPVFAVDVLHVTSENVHPAAAGYLHSVINGAPKPRRR